MSSRLLLLIPCLCVGAISLRWMSNDRSIKPLKAQLVDLQQQLQGFDELKEEFVRHRIELSWEEQRLADIEDRKKVLNRNIRHVSEDVEQFKHDNTMMDQWLSDKHGYDDKVKENDMKRVNRLAAELAAAQNEVNQAREENTALRGILAELKSLVPDEMSDFL